MFREWLRYHSAADYDLGGRLFPPAEDRAFWDRVPAGEHIKNAEAYLGFQWPLIRATQYMDFDLNGCRLSQEIPHFIRRDGLCILIIGELLEHKGRFLPDIIDGIFLICEESFWGVSAHIGGMPREGSERVIDLFAAETAALLALACHLLRGELDRACPHLIPRVEKEMRHRILQPYLQNRDAFWMGYKGPVNNWNPWILSNLLTAYLIFEKDRATLSSAVDKMIYEINAIYSLIPEDGGCDEGGSYWGVSAGCLFEFCEQLFAASGGQIDFFSFEKLSSACLFEYNIYMGGGYFASFADGSPKATHSPVGLLLMMARRFGDGRFSSLAADLHYHIKNDTAATPPQKDSMLRRRLYEVILSADVDKAAPLTPPSRVMLECVQVAVLREGFVTVAVKGGHNGENHNHNDVGSFMVLMDSVPVLVDPGCGLYTKASFEGQRYDIWACNSDWHNVPRINGQKQHEGREYAASHFSADEGEVRLGFEGAYPSEAGAVRAEREIALSGGVLRVSDSIRLSSEGEVAERFVTPFPVREEMGGVIINETYRLRCSVAAAVSLDSMDFEGDARLCHGWESDKMSRISFLLPPSAEHSAVFTLERI